jgi:thioesterase domain-containing protein
MDILSLPFSQFLGLELVTQDGQQRVGLNPQQHHQNHLGTVHAGVIYSLAEIPSGHCLLNEFDLNSDNVLAVVRSATVKYRRPAVGRLTAIGTINAETREKFAAQLSEKGRAFISVQVSVQSAEGDVLSAEFQWFGSRES